MNKALFFINEPIEFKPGIKIYPPTVKQVIINDNYEIYRRILTYSQEEVEDEFLNEKKKLDVYPTPFEFLLNNSYHNKDYEKKAKEAFQFFIHQEVTFLYELKKIVVGKLEEVIGGATKTEEIVTLTEDEFFDFQNSIRECIGQKSIEPPIQDEHPKIKEMKRKARQRDRLKAKQNSKNGISLSTMLVSICCMGIGITPLNIGELSYVAAESIFSMYQDKEKYQLDIESLLAGADSKKVKPQYWIRNSQD